MAKPSLRRFGGAMDKTGALVESRAPTEEKQLKIVDALNRALADAGALAAFNAPGYDAMTGVARAARAAGAPVIIQVSSRLAKAHGAGVIKAMFDAARGAAGAECYLHLDHCDDDALIAACVEAGWDMVMFDGSHLPIDENCRRARRIAALAHARGVAVEGEVGAIGGQEDGAHGGANHAAPEDVARLAETGVDCLAVGFGNVHGDYATKANLRWEIFEGARALAGLPLVLHGGTGLTPQEFRRAIRAGAAKINISTDLKKRYAEFARTPDLADVLLRNPAYVHDTLSRLCADAAHDYVEMFKPAGESE